MPILTTAARAAQNLPQPQDEESLLRKIGAGTLSAVGSAGNFLDLATGASSIRDVLAGQNPFDQFLTPFSYENRASGRDVGQRLGFWGANDSNRWEAADFGAFGLEVLLDPGSWVTLGGSALTRGGQLAQKANLLSDVMRIAPKGMGPRVARRSHTLRDVLERGIPEGAAREARLKSAQEAAQSMGVSLQDVLDEPLGRAVGFGLPFGRTRATSDLGPVGPAWSAGMDFMGQLLTRPGRWAETPTGAPTWLARGVGQQAATELGKAASAPGRAFRMALDPAVQGQFEPFKQEAAELAYHAAGPARVAARQAALDAGRVANEGYEKFRQQFSEQVESFGREDLDPREVAQEMDSMKQSGEWRDMQQRWEMETEPIREFRRENPSLAETARRAEDMTQVPRFDEAFDSYFNQEYGRYPGHFREPQQFFESLKNPSEAHPRLRAEAESRVRQRTLFGQTPVAGPNRQHVAQQAVETFGEQAEEFMPVMDAQARFWAREAGRDADEWYERFTQIKRSEPGDVPMEALRQGTVPAVSSGGKVYVGDSARDTHNLIASRNKLGHKSNWTKGTVDEAGNFVPEGAAPAPAAAVAGQATSRILEKMKQLEPKAQTGAMIGVGRLRGTVSDAEIMDAVRSGQVAIHKYGALQHAIENPDQFLWVNRKTGQTGFPGAEAVRQSFVPKRGHHWDWVPYNGISWKGSQTLKQAGRGAVEIADDGRAVVHAFQSADVSTLVHETAHVFRKSLEELPDPSILKRADDAVASMGVKVRDAKGNWTREADEAFASGFERYMRDGKAPTEALQGVFQKFKDWLTTIYRSIVGTPLEKNLSPQLKSFFDDVLREEAHVPWRAGDVVQAADRQNFGWVLRIGPSHSEVFFRNHETGATATRIIKNDKLSPAKGAGSPSSEEFSQYLSRSVFDRIVKHVEETGNLDEAMRLIGEGNLDAPLPEVAEAIHRTADHMHAANHAVYGAIDEKGGKTTWLEPDEVDFGIKHSPRFIDKAVAGDSYRELPTTFGGMQRRTPVTRDVPTAVVNTLATDKRYRGEKAAENILTDFEKHLDPRYGSDKGGMFDTHVPPDEALAARTRHSQELADWIAGRDRGHVYTLSNFENFLRYQRGAHTVSQMLEAAHEMFHRYAGKGDMTLREAFKQASMEPDKALAYFSRKFGVSVDRAQNLMVPAEAVNAVTALHKIASSPVYATKIGEWIDTFNRIFKTAVTVPFPSFVARNFHSGQFVNVSSGDIQGLADIAAYSRGFRSAYGLRSRALSGKLTESDQKLLDELYVHEVTTGQRGFQDIEYQGGGEEVVPQSPFAGRANLKSASEWVEMNPSLVDIVPGGRKARRGYAAVVATGSNANRTAEWFNRVPMYLYLRKKGYSASAAAKRVSELHFNYADVSEFHRTVLRRAVPFSTFTVKMAELLVNTLRERPGGILGQTIRATRLGGTDDPRLPEHVRQSTAIPNVESLFGAPPEGTRRLVTGLGLAHEAPLAFGGAGVEGALTEAASQLSPLFKFPAELAAGESFFQRGPLGGRDLADMDPTVGRTISNISEQLGYGPREDASGRARPFIGQGTEQLLSNLPPTRILTTIRQLTDPRKGVRAKAVNFLTGVRLTDVSPASQDAALRDMIQSLMRQHGARPFQNLYFKGGPQTEEQKALDAINKMLQKRARNKVSTALKRQGA